MESPLDLQESSVKTMSVSDWLIVYLITLIPIVNIIMLFVWAFGSNTNRTQSNWAKGNLILFAIILSLYLFFGLTVGLGYLFNS